MDQRIERIAQRLTPHYEDMDVVVRLLGVEEWASADLVDLENSRPFGWVPPQEDGPDVVFSLCPELIVQQTAGLDDFLFEAYVDVIQFLSDLQIAYHEIEDPYERSRMIDKRLFDAAEGSMRLLNKVQMEALDAALAR
jgi:hypothetical protein